MPNFKPGNPIQSTPRAIAEEFAREEPLPPRRPNQINPKPEQRRRSCADDTGYFEATFYNWKGEVRQQTVSEARRLGELGAENSKLKRLLAEAELDKVALNDLLGRKKWWVYDPRESSWPWAPKKGGSRGHAPRFADLCSLLVLGPSGA